MIEQKVSWVQIWPKLKKYWDIAYFKLELSGCWLSSFQKTVNYLQKYYLFTNAEEFLWWKKSQLGSNLTPTEKILRERLFQINAFQILTKLLKKDHLFTPKILFIYTCRRILWSKKKSVGFKCYPNWQNTETSIISNWDNPNMDLAPYKRPSPTSQKSHLITNAVELKWSKKR